MTHMRNIQSIVQNLEHVEIESKRNAFIFTHLTGEPVCFMRHKFTALGKMKKVT